jgi:hypothetical protein
MADLAIKTQQQFVADEIAAIQAALPGTFQFPIGSIVRAITEAHGRTAIWEESLIQFVQATTRLSTCTTDADVDSFIADFGYSRQPAVASTGNVVFSSFSTAQQRAINVGSTVSPVDGSLSFSVFPDITNENYDPILNAYIMDIGISSITVPVICAVAGVVGNVNANTLVTINSPITGVDNVNNPAAFTNGVDKQSNASVRPGFISYLNGLKRAAEGALGYAIESVQQGIDYSLVENTDYGTGLERLGYFYAVIDDGTGNPPDDLITSVYNSLAIYKGFTIRYEVQKVIPTTVTVTGTVFLPPNYTPTTLKADIEAAVREYINLIPIGGTLFYTRVADIVYQAIKADSPDLIGLFNVSNILVNSGTSDVSSDSKHALYPASGTGINFTLEGS